MFRHVFSRAFGSYAPDILEHRMPFSLFFVLYYVMKHCILGTLLARSKILYFDTFVVHVRNVVF